MGKEVDNYKGYEIVADDYGYVTIYKNDKHITDFKGIFMDGYDKVDELERKEKGERGTMQVGQIFILNGNDNYAFTGISTGGCLQAYKYSTGKNVQFKRAFNIKHSAVEITGRIDHDIVRDQERKAKFEQEVRAMVHGDRFIGNDGNTYEFKRFKRTQFAFSDVGATDEMYSAKPGFVKQILK